MKNYRLQNLDCPTCAAKLENAIGKLESVNSVSIDFSNLTMSLETTDMDAVNDVIGRLEPEVKVLPAGTTVPEDEGVSVPEVAVFAVSAAVFVATLVLSAPLERAGLGWIRFAAFAAVYLASGWKVILAAFRNILKGDPFDESFLMTVATIGAFAVGALSEAAGTMLFFQIGEFFQDLAVRNSRRSVKALLGARPDRATLKEGETLRVVNPEEVRPGDLVVVKPGEKIPLDGTVVTGSTLVDTAALTGEPVPRRAGPGSEVLAGMIDTTGLITVRVTRPFADSSIARVMDLVENATQKKAKTELFFTRFARTYTPVVVALAVLVAVVPPLVTGAALATWVYRALVILVISCPCALVVSIPLAYFAGIGRAAQRGILIKGSSFLDTLAGLDTVVFDKTGTLTKGTFTVLDIVPKNGEDRETMLSLAAAAEAHSNHPIAAALRAAAPAAGGLPVTAFEDFAGAGVRATVGGHEVIVGNDRILHRFDISHEVCEVSCDDTAEGSGTKGSAVHVAADGRYLGWIIVGDELKSETRQTVADLRAAGVRKVMMLSGDTEESAATTAAALRLDGYRAGLLPEDKVGALEHVTAAAQVAAHARRWRQGRRYAAFVGDGINDAPVLARADVGISMGNLGADAAVETADVIIMDDSLVKIPEAIRIARKTKRILAENVVFALGIKVAFIVLGFFGIATMWEAVFGDVGVALIAILNALRILGYRDTPTTGRSAASRK